MIVCRIFVRNERRVRAVTVRVVPRLFVGEPRVFFVRRLPRSLCYEGYEDAVFEVRAVCATASKENYVFVVLRQIRLLM